MKVPLYYPENYQHVSVSPPYPLMYLAKALLDAGHEPEIIDARFQPNHLEVVEKLTKSSPYLFVSASMPVEAISSIPAAKIAGENNSEVVLGGVFATFNKERILGFPYVDGVVSGQGEKAAVEIMEKGISNACNTAYIQDDRLVENKTSGFIDLNDYSPLPWELVNVEDYVRRQEGLLCLEYASSRGCPHDCIYCSQSRLWGKRFRSLSAENTLNEIRLAGGQAGFECVNFFDDNFLTDRKRAFKIMQGLRDEGLLFSIQARASDIDEPLVEKLKAGNCVKICVGAESGCQRTLDYVGKNITLKQTREAAKLIGEYGLKSEFYFMLGFPNEGMEEIRQTLELADYVEEKAQAETLTRVAIPFTGTRYHEAAVKEGFQRDSSVKAVFTESWDYNPPSLPWLTQEENKFIQNIALLSLLRYYDRKYVENMGFLDRYSHKILKNLWDYRWRHRFFKMPVDLKIHQKRRLSRNEKMAGKIKEEILMQSKGDPNVRRLLQEGLG